MSVAFTSW